ncbi:MAG: phosphate ABC transporter permease PstA [Sedimentisphaerales bacterium]|nr:phosphate ABC transporter permease PstA [Sedimentisphaerales bacterium]
MKITPAASQRFVVAFLWLITSITLLVLLFIIGYILVHGLGHINWSFLTESSRRMGREGGIFPMIVGTILVTGLAVIIAAPVGVLTTIYLTEYTREGKLTSIIRFGTDCLAAIPSIIFGLFGFVFFVVVLRMGFSIISGALTLAIMVLPTIIRTSEEAIRAVPKSYREVSYGLGSTRWQMVTKVVLKSALPGIGTGIVLSIGRCISETAAVMLTAGSALRMPDSPFASVRTLSLHFYILSREGISMENAYATASVLIITILVINVIAYLLMRRLAAKVR